MRCRALTPDCSFPVGLGFHPEPDLADLHAAIDELCARCADVGNHQLKSLERSRGHVRHDPFADDNGASGSGWRQLNDSVAH